MREDIPRPTADTILEHLEANPPEPSSHPHPGAHSSVREADHRGHHIVVRTTYEIEVDGVPIEGHLGVTDDGNVHYHPVPNLAFASAVDLVKQLIDVFPDDFAAPVDTDHGAHEPGGYPRDSEGPHDHEAHGLHQH